MEGVGGHEPFRSGHAPEALRKHMLRTATTFLIGLRGDQRHPLCGSGEGRNPRPGFNASPSGRWASSRGMNRFYSVPATPQPLRPSSTMGLKARLPMPAVQ